MPEDNQTPNTEPTNETIANWMAQEIERKGYLDQSSAAYYIYRNFGEKFTYRNKNKNRAIKKEVLEIFTQLTEDTVVWSRSNFRWRKRKPSDPPDTRMVR
jgi:hypothetical protein